MEEYKLFIENVRQMRKAQRDYFRTRDIMYLRLSKQKEKIVDYMLKGFEQSGTNEPLQLDLGL